MPHIICTIYSVSSAVVSGHVNPRPPPGSVVALLRKVPLCKDASGKKLARDPPRMPPEGPNDP